MKRIIVYVVLVFFASSSGKAKVEEELANRIQEINRLEDIVAESHSKIIELTSAIESINADLDNCYGKSKQFQNSTDWLLNDSDWGTLVFYGVSLIWIKELTSQ